MRKIIILVIAGCFCVETFAQSPELIWARQGIGGKSIASDGLGNIYLASNELLKADSTGNIIWTKKFGNSFLQLNSITSDESGNVYSVGAFGHAVDFDPGEGSYILESDRGYNVYVSKLNTDGNFLWARKMADKGGGQGGYGYSIAVSGNGSVASTGSFDTSGDFHPGEPTILLPMGRHSYNFKEFPHSWLLLERMVSNSYPYWGDGNVLPGFNAFFSLLTPEGNYQSAASLSGTTNHTLGRSVAFDPWNNLYATGFYNGEGNISRYGYNRILLPSTDGNSLYIIKWKSPGLTYHWARAIKNISQFAERSDRRIATDDQGNVFVTGFFEGTVDFNPGEGIHHLTAWGSQDAFVLKLDHNGDFLWVRQIGGELADKAYNLDVDKDGSIIITGIFSGLVDFDPNHESFFLLSDNETDNFVLKLNSEGQFCWAFPLAIPPQALSVKVDVNDRIYLTGHFDMPIDVNPGNDQYILDPAGGRDFVIKLTNPNPESFVPIDIRLSNKTVYEGSEIETIVGSFTTIDADSLFVYTLEVGEGDDDNHNFRITGNELLTISELDYETQPVHTIRVQTKDSSGNTFSKSFQIMVLNVNEFLFVAPADVQLECFRNIPEAYNDLGSFVLAGGFAESDCGLEEGSFRVKIETLKEWHKNKALTRTYEVADKCGNVSEALHVISFIDGTPPTVDYGYYIDFGFFCNGLDLVFNLNGYLPLSLSPREVSLDQFIDAGYMASDNCGIKRITYSDWFVSICPNILLEREFIITDDFGNTLKEVYLMGGDDYFFGKEPLVLTLIADNQFGGCSVEDMEAFTKLPFSPTIRQITLWQTQLREAGLNISCWGCEGRCDIMDMTYIDSVSYSEPIQTVSRTFYFSNFCGDHVSIVQTILLGDTIEPIFECPPDIELGSIDELPAPFTTLASFVTAGGSVFDNSGINEVSFRLVEEERELIEGLEAYRRTYYIEDYCGNPGVCVHNIKIVQPTSLLFPEVINTIKYSIIPNPAPGFFKLRFESAVNGIITMELINIAGQTIDLRSLSNASVDHYESYDISGLPEGTYYLTIRSGEIQVTDKVINMKGTSSW